MGCAARPSALARCGGRRGRSGAGQEGAQGSQHTAAAATAETPHRVEVNGEQNLSHGRKGQPLPRDPPGSGRVHPALWVLSAASRGAVTLNLALPFNSFPQQELHALFIQTSPQARKY